MKTFAKVSAVLSAVLLLFALLVGGIYGIFTDKEWVKKEYDRIDIESQTGWSSDYCTEVLGSMMDYSIGTLKTLEDVPLPHDPDSEAEPFFNEKELSHMVDVRALTLAVLRLGLAALILGFVLYVVALAAAKYKGLRRFAAAFLIALGVLLVIIIALGIWMAVDFDSFWEMFHVVFLDLESSTFDPAVSNMIRICPAELFSDFIKHFALLCLAPLTVCTAACIVYLCVNKLRKFAPGILRTLFWLISGFCCVVMLGYLLTELKVFIVLALVGFAFGLVCNIAAYRRGEV